MIEFEDTFEGTQLDRSKWLPYYLPHWSSRERTAARYVVRDGLLTLRIEPDQGPWCPEFDGDVRTSTLQTGLFAGPLGSGAGQLRFRPEVVVREEQRAVRLYTPQYGLIEIRCRATDDPKAMVALWMIGYEDEPERSGEICVCEIFGRDVGPDSAKVGMGVHPFHDPKLTDEWAAEALPIDARAFHVYAVDWTPDHVAFYVDGEHVKTVGQSPDYPMQLMLSVYDFPNGEPPDPHAKEFVVDYVRGTRRS
jgi:hypothetical protein